MSAGCPADDSRLAQIDRDVKFSHFTGAFRRCERARAGATGAAKGGYMDYVFLAPPVM